MEGLFLDSNSVKQGIAPQDGIGALAGARISMSKATKCVFIVELGAGAGTNIVPSLDQHDAASGGTSKALNIKANYYYKLASSTAFTKVEVRPDDSGLSDSVDLSAEIAANAATIVIEVLDSHLDVSNDFDHVSLNMEAAGGAKEVSSTIILRNLDKQAAYSEDV